MIGLLVKDCYLVFQRKQMLVILLAVTVLMGISTDGSFVVGYLSMLTALLALSTISYDDADNGMMFLLTLPVERKTYAFSKYLLGALFCGAAWIVAVLLMFGIAFMKGQPLDLAEGVVSSLAFLPMSALILDMMIPLQLKFGAEKSRIMMIAVFGGFAAVGMVISRSASGIIDPGAVLAVLDRIPVEAYALLAIVVCLVATGVSMIISRRILEKKVF